MQVPVQVVAQQTLCWQMLELQSSLVVQEPPTGRLPQLPPVQTLPPPQSALLVHAPRQALPALLSHT